MSTARHRSVVHVWMLAAWVHRGDCDQRPAVPRVAPGRLQFFEYESISLSCRPGSAGWRLMRGGAAAGSPERAPGTVNPALSSHSGAYWCEDGHGLRGGAVNISVTAGHVILESPAEPVREGDHVTLLCRKKKSAADPIADFYKDGVYIVTGYHGNMVIRNASASDEGLYKCRVEGAESAESLLAVREPVGEEPPASPGPPPAPALPWVASTALVAALVLLAASVWGVLRCRRARAQGRAAAGGDPNRAVYAAVEKTKRVKVSGVGDVVGSQHATYAVIQKQRKKTEPGASRQARPPEDSVVYSTVALPVGSASPR